MMKSLVEKPRFELHWDCEDVTSDDDDDDLGYVCHWIALIDNFDRFISRRAKTFNRMGQKNKISC